MCTVFESAITNPLFRAGQDRPPLPIRLVWNQRGFVKDTIAKEMLTILHRKSDGGEKLFMAENIELLQKDGEQSVPCHTGKFIAHGVIDSGVPSDYYQFEIEQPFGAVFVMNDKGATVARYLASPPA
jgi:hypothetical protein